MTDESHCDRLVLSVPLFQTSGSVGNSESTESCSFSIDPLRMSPLRREGKIAARGLKSGGQGTFQGAILWESTNSSGVRRKKKKDSG